jgi:Uma2 family endonuclease
MVSAILESLGARERVLPLSVRAYHDLAERGLISEKAELLRGVIFEKMPKSRFHVRLVRFLEALLRQQLPAEYLLQKEDPITCLDSEPEPDLAVILGVESDFIHEHPHTAEFIIEVALSTLDTDRSKAEIYAEAGVKEYWLVDAENRTVEVHRQPGSSGYALQEVVHTLAMSSVIPSFQLDVAAMFAEITA